jgi:hypothetical protein
MLENWSEERIELTRKTLEDLLDGMYPGPRCTLKKIDGEERIYGHIMNSPGFVGRKDDDEIVIIGTDGTERRYTSVNGIISDGWAVD